jgi:hypothetical protein
VAENSVHFIARRSEFRVLWFFSVGRRFSVSTPGVGLRGLSRFHRPFSSVTTQAPDRSVFALPVRNFHRSARNFRYRAKSALPGTIDRSFSWLQLKVSFWRQEHRARAPDSLPVATCGALGPCPCFSSSPAQGALIAPGLFSADKRRFSTATALLDFGLCCRPCRLRLLLSPLVFGQRWCTKVQVKVGFIFEPLDQRFEFY